MDDYLPKLPIKDYRQQILQSVAANQVTIVVAETGAGKSTQLPQYLAEEGYKKIVVTQPRILAARNLSRRVREEWTLRSGKDDDQFVGYRTANERDDTPGTTILYCTDGLQLVREITGIGTLDNQVLVLDEVHEWNENIEVLVAWAKKRCQEDAQFKVVVMSATIEADKLANYFQTAPPIIVPGRQHEVKMRRSRDVVSEIIEKLESGISSNILVFLPGKSEIENVADAIKRQAVQINVPVLPLHGQLEVDVQQKVFETYLSGKVVLSTNVAQTSITIDDIDVVIDSGLERRSEVQNGVEGLFMAQISQADCLQRAGRAGRTKPGEYILAPFDGLACLPLEKRDNYPVPEILRKHIDRLTLRLASVGIDIEALDFYHDPSIKAIKAAKKTLRSLGAMDKIGDITNIGRAMEHYPVESSYARMLVQAEGYAEDVQNKLIAIIAIQEVGGIVRGGTRFTGWRDFTKETQSDLLAQYDVYLRLDDINELKHEELGIITKNVSKAEDTMQKLWRGKSSRQELSPIDLSEKNDLMRAVVAGQVDNLWMVEEFGVAVHLYTKQRRELSSSSVVRHASLVSGEAFDLEIQTKKGLEVLHLVQELTTVKPEWLEQLAPHLFDIKWGRYHYDAATQSLARRQTILYSRKIIGSTSAPVTETTARNYHMFTEMYAKWLHEKLERQRRALQNGYGRKVPKVFIETIEERIRQLAPNILSLNEVTAPIRRQLQDLGDMRNHLDEHFIERMETVSHGRSHSHKRSSPRGWQPSHKRKYNRSKER